MSPGPRAQVHVPAGDGSAGPGLLLLHGLPGGGKGEAGEQQGGP